LLFVPFPKGLEAITEGAAGQWWWSAALSGDTSGGVASITLRLSDAFVAKRLLRLDYISVSKEGSNGDESALVTISKLAGKLFIISWAVKTIGEVGAGSYTTPANETLPNGWNGLLNAPQGTGNLNIGQQMDNAPLVFTSRGILTSWTVPPQG
jgi:hypothetical protein